MFPAVGVHFLLCLCIVKVTGKQCVYYKDDNTSFEFTSCSCGCCGKTINTACCNCTKDHVTSEDTSTGSFPVIAIVIPVVLAALALVVIAVCCWWCKTRTPKNLPYKRNQNCILDNPEDRANGQETSFSTKSREQTQRNQITNTRKEDNLGEKQMMEYQVYVYTSDVEKAATGADIFLNIWGDGEECGRQQLKSNVNNSKMFQQGEVDEFKITAVHLGELQRIVVTKGPGLPWHLDKICVKYTSSSNTEYVFEADRWIGSIKDTSVEVEETLTLAAHQTSHPAS